MHGKDESASTETKKRITKEEKRQAKIRNIEKNRMLYGIFAAILTSFSEINEKRMEENRNG